MLDKTIIVSNSTPRSKTATAVQLARPITSGTVWSSTPCEYYDVKTMTWETPASQDGSEGLMRAVIIKPGPDGLCVLQIWTEGQWKRFVGLTSAENSATGKEWDANQYF